MVKFSQLAVGQRFEFQGQHYTKSSPLLATADSGGAQRMMMRAALVSPLGNQLGNTVDHKDVAASIALRCAIDDYHASCLHSIEQLASAENHHTLATLRQQLEQARLRLLALATD